jgi:hypothetical protein
MTSNRHYLRTGESLRSGVTLAFEGPHRGPAWSEGSRDSCGVDVANPGPLAACEHSASLYLHDAYRVTS